MLHENIKNIRKSKGLSQQELANKLNVVRQTISKWEKGLSVPDSEMLLSISEVLETPVSTLLGASITHEEESELKIISEKLEVINLQLSQRSIKKRKIVHLSFIAFSTAIILIFILLYLLKSPYLGWDYEHPEIMVIGVLFHYFEWIFVRLAPFAFILSSMGVFLTRRKC